MPELPAPVKGSYLISPNIVRPELSAGKAFQLLPKSGLLGMVNRAYLHVNAATNGVTTEATQ